MVYILNLVKTMASSRVDDLNIPILLFLEPVFEVVDIRLLERDAVMKHGCYKHLLLYDD